MVSAHSGIADGDGLRGMDMMVLAVSVIRSLPVVGMAFVMAAFGVDIMVDLEAGDMAATEEMAATAGIHMGVSATGSLPIQPAQG